MSNCGCEGSCPICRTGEVDNHTCNACKANFCPTCHGIASMPINPWRQAALTVVELCSCEKTEHDEPPNELMAAIEHECGPTLVRLRQLVTEDAELVAAMVAVRRSIQALREKHPAFNVTDFAVRLDEEDKVLVALLGSAE
jgi:hypothetical protein